MTVPTETRVQELAAQAGRDASSGFFAAMAAADQHLDEVEQLRAENEQLRELAGMWANGYLTAHNKRAQLLRENAVLRRDLAAAMEVVDRINAIPTTECEDRR